MMSSAARNSDYVPFFCSQKTENRPVSAEHQENLS